MKKLNKRSSSSPSLRGACNASDVAIQRRCCSSVIPEIDIHVSRAAFTLVELVITIAIVIILSVISVPIYRGYVDKAKMSEAYALLGTFLSAEKAYYSEYGNFYQHSTGGLWSSYDEVLGIDARGNKYFTSFVPCYNWDAKKSVAINLMIPKDLQEKYDNASQFRIVYNITSGTSWDKYVSGVWVQ